MIVRTFPNRCDYCPRAGHRIIIVRTFRPLSPALLTPDFSRRNLRTLTEKPSYTSANKWLTRRGVCPPKPALLGLEYQIG